MKFGTVYNILESLNIDWDGVGGAGSDGLFDTYIADTKPEVVIEQLSTFGLYDFDVRWLDDRCFCLSFRAPDSDPFMDWWVATVRGEA